MEMDVKTGLFFYSDCFNFDVFEKTAKNTAKQESV
jgi:hypothetical protein